MKSSQDFLGKLLATVHELSRGHKLRLIQHPVVNLAHEEGISQLEVGASYPIWTPLEAHDAAAELMKLLDAQGVVS